MKIVIFLSLCLFLAGCAERSLPPEKNILRMTAALFNQPNAVPDIKEFTIAPKDYDKVLSLFKNKERDKSGSKWQCLGFVKVEDKSSSKLMIGLFWTGGGTGAFEIENAHYRGSSDKVIISVLNDCRKAVQDQK